MTIDDEYTFQMRMCDDEGMVSHTPIDEVRDIPLLDPKLTYLDRLNFLRNLTRKSQGDKPETIDEPFTCTGHAHLVGEHIRCTSPAHQRHAYPEPKTIGGVSREEINVGLPKPSGVDIERIVKTDVWGDERYMVQRTGTLGFIRQEDGRWFFEPFDKMRIYKQNLWTIYSFIAALEA